MTKPRANVRLALCEENDFWVAYIAPVGTMDGAFEIGRLHMKFAATPAFFERFKTLVTDAFRAALNEAGVAATQMDERPAPDHERAGRPRKPN